MGLQATPREIKTSRTTNVVLNSDRANWTPGSPGSPIFTITGAVGDNLVDQVILDSGTAVISISSTQANANIQIKDTKNNEAVSINVWGAAQFTSMGKQAVDNNSKVAEGKHNQSGR